MIINQRGSKRLMVSHIADIDGMGSVILANKYFNNDLDYILCEVLDLCEVFNYDLSMYEEIFVCDLQICEDAIEVLKGKDDYISKLKHFDHHSSMINDNMPGYVNYVVFLDDRRTCGTELFYRYLLSFDDSLNKEFYKTLVEAIRANDTWDMNGDFEGGRKLASIHAMIGAESFIDMVSKLDDNDKFVLPEVYEKMYIIDQEKMERYIDNACKNLYITTYKEYKIGVTLSEQYRSILGDEICKRNPELDFALIVNFERMTGSLRCVKDGVDLGQICLEFHKDGGGHKKAAGFRLDSESIPKIQEYVVGYLNKYKDVR